MMARKAAFFGVALALGLAAELLTIEILPGSYLSLGMASVLAVSLGLHPLAGLVLMFIIKPIFASKVGNLFVLLVYALEILFVAGARRLRPKAGLVVVEAVFWPLIGTPILGLAYRYGLGISPETVWITVLKVWFAELVNAYLAGLVVDSGLASGFLGEERGRRDIASFIKDRVNLLLIPLAFLALVAVVNGFRQREESNIAYRLEVGLDRAGDAIDAGGPEALSSLSRPSARLFDPDGRYEIGPAGESLPGPPAAAWREGFFVRYPASYAHPLDRWRGSEYLGFLERKGLRLYYVIGFESSFLFLARLYSIALAVCLALFYGTYGIVSFASSSLARRIGLLLVPARRLPDRIEAGDRISWPDSDIEEFAELSREFRSVSDRLGHLVKELRASRDGFEAAVADRTAELEERTEEVRLLLARVELEREEERRRVARELHDELGQGISSLGMELYLLERHLGADAGERSAEKIADMRAVLAGLSESMRRLIADLRPSVLDRIGLPEALARLAGELAERSGLDIAFSSDLPEDLALSDETKTVAYRLGQEAVVNAVRHSGSERIRLSLREEGGHLVLEVADEGRGFDAAAGAGRGARSFGIIGMRERCLALGGSLSIVSAPGEGSLVRATLPVVERKDDARPHC